MAEIITPKNALELVLQRKTKPITLTPWENKTEKSLFCGALLLFGCGAIIGIVNQIWHNNVTGLFGLIFLLLSMFMGIGYQIAVAWPLFAKLRHSEKDLSQPVVSEFNDDIDLIHQLTRDFQPLHLEYARNNFYLLSEQLRTRIGMLVGAIEKVGIIPLAATAYLSGQKAIKEGAVVFSEIEWIFAAFILLYLLAVHMVSVAQKIDRVALIYKQALSTQSSSRQL